jgi:hypothetical protein
MFHADPKQHRATFARMSLCKYLLTHSSCANAFVAICVINCVWNTVYPLLGGTMLGFLRSYARLTGNAENAQEVARLGVATPERIREAEQFTLDPNSYLIGRKKKEYYE